MSSIRIRKAVDNQTFDVRGEPGEDVYEKRGANGWISTCNLLAKV